MAKLAHIQLVDTPGERGDKLRLTTRWLGQLRHLEDDTVVEFTEFLPFRPRGAQILLDPFEPEAGEVPLSGRVLSPGRILDPGCELQAWCDGQVISLNGGDSFQATALLHAGTDQIHLRASDATRLQGRAYVSTWTPRPPEDESAETRTPLLDHNQGEHDEENPPPPVCKPTRYGRTRAEVQRFAILPALLGEESIDLVLKDEEGSELGRVTLELEHQGDSRSWTEWVCITETDRLAEPALDAVEGKVLRVPNLQSTLELQRSGGGVVGDPLRMSGLDFSHSLTPIRRLDDPETPVELDVVLGGRYELDALNLSWMTTADADQVLLPGEGVEEGSEDILGALQGHQDALGDLEQVDLGQEKVRLPTGWGALTLEADEAKDPWEHDEVLDLVTYREAPELDSPEADDFVHTARPARVQWHATEEWAVNPDQIYVKLGDGMADADLVELCQERGLRVAGTIRRDAHILLESREPLDIDEVQTLAEDLSGESALELAIVNYIMFAEAENVATVRVPDVMRGGAAIAPQPGCYRPYDILTLRHHLQTRAFPAQQILHHLRFQQTPPQSPISLAITDDGFGNATLPNISPDFAIPRLPWLGRLPGNGAGLAAGTWAAFPANVGATLAFTNPAMIDPGGAATPHLSGHGTRTLHAMAGHGTTFAGLQSTAPALAPAAAPIANYQASPWCVGVNPFAQVLPMRTIGVAGGTLFSGISGVRFAFLQGIQVVNTSAGADGIAGAATHPFYTAIVNPMLAFARTVGGIWVVSGGNQPLAHNQHIHSAIAPTGARGAATNPVVAVTPTSQTLLPSSPLGPNFPLTFTNPWNSLETRVLNGWDADFGPESTVAAPGDDLNLRAYSLTAASTSAHLARGSGTSFAAPQVAGLLGLMKLANSIMGHAVGRPGVGTPADASNRLIDLMCFTAHKDQPLFNAAEVAALYSTELGHGRVDHWAAVLSALNDGPMFAGTAPHANLVNTGTYIQPGAAEIFWGFELDTPAYHAQPWLVNVDTGVSEQIVDALALDPAIDPTDPARPAWTYQVRAGGTGDQILPPSSHPGPTPSYMMQFTIRKTRLQSYTHLCFQRGANEPPIVSTPGSPDLAPGAPNLFYYGLPLVPLMNHRVTGPDIAPFQVDMRHFIFKAHTNQHDRRLRVTFDRVEITGNVTGGKVEVQWTVGAAASGYRSHYARQNSVTFLGGASHAFYQAENAPLPIAFEVKGLGTANVSYPPPATPTAANFTPWGLGYRFLEVAGKFKVYFRVEQEPNLPRGWKVELETVKLKSVPVGSYIFAVESGGIRSGWSAETQIAAVTAETTVTVPVGTVVARSPFVPDQTYRAALRVQNLTAMTSGHDARQPSSLASNAVETMVITANPINADGTVKVSSEVVPQIFV